jgi:CheY-like chemotaxis protein
MDKILRLAAGRQIDLVTSLSASPWPVIADAGQIEQVVMNLAVNARDAMPDGGVLTVSTANVTLDDEQAGEFLNVDPGDYVCLCVEDTGTGMDARVRSHLFEPFFTTKEKGKGTGLGLATVYGIVKQSAGGVSVRSAPGAGSAFRVYLPRAADVARPSPPLDSSLAARILVVEDDPLVLDFLARVLSGHGYDVTAARGAEEAMRVCASDAPLDVLITDVTMPVMDGWQLAADVLRRRPSVKVLYISGYAETLPHGPTSPSPDIRFLQKPFSSASLLSKVREVLQPPPS